MNDYLEQVHWAEMQALMLEGTPPLYIKLLILNAVFVLLFIHRRFRLGKKKVMARPAYGLQSLLVVANFMVLYQDRLFNDLYLQRVLPFMRHMGAQF